MNNGLDELFNGSIFQLSAYMRKGRINIIAL